MKRSFIFYGGSLNGKILMLDERLVEFQLPIPIPIISIERDLFLFDGLTKSCVTKEIYKRYHLGFHYKEIIG
jgi:hypothetical protein